MFCTKIGLKNAVKRQYTFDLEYRGTLKVKL